MSILVACIMYNKWQNNTKERHAKAEGAGAREEEKGKARRRGSRHGTKHKGRRNQ